MRPRLAPIARIEIDWRRRRKVSGIDWIAVRRKTKRQIKEFQQSLEETGRAVSQELSPLMVRAVASMTGYTLGLFSAQSLGYLCRVSCATPIMGSALGGVGVAGACALAGQFSRAAQLIDKEGIDAVSRPAFREVRREHVIVDILVGVLLYKVTGGKFRSVMPSDLFHPGAFAKKSLPARLSVYATPNERIELGEYFRQHGCHSCGKKWGSFVADHMPPSKFALIADPLVFADRLGFGKQARMVARVMDVSFRPPAQRFYPQCSSCSSRQGTAVRMNKRALVLHFGGPRVYHAGCLVGVREYD